jgi:hypothetical protein
MTKRTFTPAEERGLSEKQKAYLDAHPTMSSLQSGSMLLPREQLYLSLIHGAVTIDRAMELDKVHSRYRARESQINTKPIFDNYTVAEDRFIDQEGMSSGLH